MAKVLSSLDINIQGEGVLTKRNKFIVVNIPSTGEVKHFDCGTKNDQRALIKALAFVKAVEEEYGEVVYWHFRGDNVMNVGADFKVCRKTSEKFKHYGRAILGYFFDVD